MNSIAEKPFPNWFKTGWQIFRHELLFITWALMEVALITPLFLALTPWTSFWSPAVTTIWLLLIMLIPFNLSRLTSVLRISVQRQQLIMVFALFITLLLAWRTVLYSPSGLLATAWLADIIAHFGDSTNPLWSRELALFVLAYAHRHSLCRLLRSRAGRFAGAMVGDALCSAILVCLVALYRFDTGRAT
jgi:hypothetical protein